MIHSFRSITTSYGDLDLDIDAPEVDELLRELAHCALTDVAGEFESVAYQDGEVRFAVEEDGQLVDIHDRYAEPISGSVASVEYGIGFQYTHQAAPRKDY